MLVGSLPAVIGTMASLEKCKIWRFVMSPDWKMDHKIYRSQKVIISQHELYSFGWIQHCSPVNIDSALDSNTSVVKRLWCADSIKGVYDRGGVIFMSERQQI